MNTISIFIGVLGLIGLLFGCFCAHKLYQWERFLKGARLAIAYKGKTKMQPTLLELMRWAITVSKDPNATGRAFYKMSSTTVAILQPRPKSHGATVTTQVKEKQPT